MANKVDTIASNTDFNNARTEVTNYCTNCKTLIDELTVIITKLTAAGGGFNGDAAAGYLEFYNKIKPVLTTQLCEGPESLMTSLSKMLTSIEDALMGQMDPNLGQANRDAAPAEVKAS